MKTRTALGRLFLVLVTIGWVVPAFAQTVPPAKAKVTGSKEAPAAKAEEKEGTIVGLAITRASGGFLGLSIEGGTFKLAFYNAKKKPIAADVAQGMTRWMPTGRKGIEIAPLSRSSDGKALVGSKIVQPPLNFRVFVVLLNEAGDAVESYAVDYRD